MTETTVPRAARFADLRVGMTVERVYIHPSGTTRTLAGVASKVTARDARDDANFCLAASRDDDNPRVTLRILEEPPKPALPAVAGTVIDCTLDGEPGAVLVRDVDGDWNGVDGDGECTTAYTSQLHRITDWTIRPRPTADPLDENDHRDRIDRDGCRITRHGNKHWHTKTTTCYGHCEDNSLENWNASCGPLRFADEVTA